jgi:FlaA1/EpsC-like NDP-sugar epimerase
MKKQFEFLSQTKKYDLNAYNIVVFGAGNTSVLYQECFKQEKIKPVYYIDNNPEKLNATFYGTPVISLEDLVSLRQTFSKPLLILICSMNTDSCFQIK